MPIFVKLNWVENQTIFGEASLLLNRYLRMTLHGELEMEESSTYGRISGFLNPLLLEFKVQ